MFFNNLKKPQSTQRDYAKVSKDYISMLLLCELCESLADFAVKKISSTPQLRLIMINFRL